MKNKSTRIVAFFLALFIIQGLGVFAGHGEHQRNKCKWYAKRFRANSHLWFPCLIPICYHHSGHCDYANSSCSAAGFGCTATSSSHAGWDGCWGSSNGCGGVCAGQASDLMQEFDLSMPNGIDYAASQKNKAIVTFKGDTVYIEGLQIFLSGNIADANSNQFILTTWLPRDDDRRGIEDTIITPGKTVQFGDIRLISGQLAIKGTLFSASDFKVERIGSIVNVTYIGGTKKVYVRGQESIDVAVSSEGDIIKSGSAVAETALAQSEQKITMQAGKLNVFPNPATNDISIEHSISGFSPTLIKIFNLDGKVVSEVKITDMMQEGAVIKVPVKQLFNGEYLVMATDGKEKYLKKFIKQ